VTEDVLQNLAAEVVEALNASNQVLATAESCTGGWLSKAITDVSGSSEVFDRGFVTYSNQAKMEMLNVSSECLQQNGAVSEETTLQMVAGAVKNSSATIAISTSGIAGPGGGSEEKPVGTICFGWMTASEKFSDTQVFSGDRDSVRYQSCCFAFKKLLELLA